jgi:hypothetical protein
MSISNLDVPNNDTIFCGTLSCSQGVSSTWNGTSNEYSGKLLGVPGNTGPGTLIFSLPAVTTGHVLYGFELRTIINCVAGPTNTGYIDQYTFYTVPFINGVVGTIGFGNLSLIRTLFTNGSGIELTVTGTTLNVYIVDINGGASDTLNVVWKVNVITNVGP